MIDSTSALSKARASRVTKPKLYDEQLSFLVEAGTNERIEAARGPVKKAVFLRKAVDAAVAKGLRREKK